MIFIGTTRGSVEALDGGDTTGRYLEIQIGPLFFMFYIGRGR